MTNKFQRRKTAPAGGAVDRRGRIFLFAAAMLASAVTGSAQPANDNFVDAIVLPGSSGTTNGTYRDATAEAGEPLYNGIGAFSVWYRWTAPSSGLVTFDTMGRSIDTVVAVYTGTSVDGLSPILSNYVAVASCITFPALSGTSYYIQVLGNTNDNSSGNFVLNWLTGSPPFGDSRFAGQFRFLHTGYAVTEFESSRPFRLGLNPSSTQRSALGSIFTVTRVGGSAGRALVDYRTMDEISTQYVASTVTTVTNIVNPTNNVYTNFGNVVTYFTNVYLPSSRVLSNFFLNTWVTSTNICGGETNCTMTSLISNCVNFSSFYGCPRVDYLPTSGTLVFNEFETSKKFVVPVLSDFAENGDKLVRLELSNPRLAPEELANPTGLLPPTRDCTNSTASLDIREIYPGFNNGNNFSLERVCYAVNEAAGSISVDIIHPSAGAGAVTVHVVGVSREELYGTSEGSDYAASASDLFSIPLFTGGFTNIIEPQDFTGFTTNIMFTAGQFRRSVNIPIADDDFVEFNEDILVFLEQPTPTDPPIGANGSAIVTILDNDQPAGALDRDWNPDNVAFTTPRFNEAPGANNIVRAVAVQADQRTLLGGDFTAYNSTPRNGITRVNLDGSLDATFNPGTGADGFVAALAIYPPTGGTNIGKILAGGGFSSMNNIQRNGVARLNGNGALDLSFNPGTGANGVVRSIALQSDGKVLLAGEFTQFDGVPRNGVARLNLDGKLDLNFNPGHGADGTVWSVAVRDSLQTIFVPRGPQPLAFEDVNEIETGGNQGTIVIDYDFGPNPPGDPNPDNLRVYYDGVRIFDTTLSGAGQQTINYGPGASTKVTIVINEGIGTSGETWRYTANISVPVLQRKIFIGGEFFAFNGQYRGNVARLNDDGSLDNGYDSGGGANGPVYAVALQADGRLLIGGSFSAVDFQDRLNLARLEVSGALDLSYNPGSGANDAVYGITVQPDGAAFVGGLFTSFNGTRRLGLTRLLANGAVDTSFLDTAYDQFAGLINTFHFEPPNFVSSIALQTNGGVIIGGSFTTLGGQPARNVSDNTPWILSGSSGGATGWHRADKHPRYNVARLIGGYTPGPGNVEFVYDQNTVDENAGELSVALRRLDGRLGSVSAVASSSDNLAVGGTDFGAAPNVLSWNQNTAFDGVPIGVGSTSERFFGIPIFDDTLIEGDELFGLRLGAPSGSINLGGEVFPLGAALSRKTATVDIIDDDFNRGTFVFSSPTFFTNENAGFARITVLRTNGSSGQVAVKYFTSDGTAVAGQDYTTTRGTLTFGQGVTSLSFNVPLRDDVLVEPDETFLVALTNATGGAILPGGTPTSVLSATVTIIDNDLPPGRANFASSSFVASEGAGVAAITLVRLGGSVGELSVSVAATGGSAQEGIDFVPATNVITWVDGDIAPKIFPVTINNDVAVEGDETVGLRLFNPSVVGGTGSVSTATLTIQDDDFYGALSFSQSVFDADERGTNVSITVVRVGGEGDTVTVDYEVADGSAVNGRDFIAANGTLTFGPGVLATNFSVTILNKTLQDGERQAMLLLKNFNLASPGAITTATLRIMDDESMGDLAGSRDTSFSPLAGGTNSLYALALQPDGKLLVGGDFRTLNRELRNRVGRLNPDGTLDESFDAKQGPNAAVRSIALQSDGRIVIGGFFDKVHSTNRNHIARLLADGTLDRYFDPGAGADNPVFAVAVHPDGRIVMGGSFATVNGINRAGIALLESSGKVSTSFDPGQGIDGTVLALAVQNDGKILVGGEFATVNGVSQPNLARLNLDGSLDRTFDPGRGPNGAVRAITLQADGKILVGGSFTDIDGNTRNHLARLTPTGALDSVFLSGTEGADADVTGIALQFDGQIIVVGDFTHFNGVTRNRITRLYRSGKTDPTINFGEGANEVINSVVIQVDRKIVIGGRFTTFDGQPRFYLARLHGGSIAGPGSVQFSAPFYSVLENAGQLTIAVERRGGTTGDVTVDYATVPGSATPDLDYTSVSGTLTFAEGETRQTFTVPIVNDSVGEPNETVLLVLSNQTPGVTLGAIPNATLIILNDDSGVGFSSASYTVNENTAGGNVVISVLRTGATNGTATVNYSTVDGTALAGQDYVAQRGLLTFAPGQALQSFSVPIIDDLRIEPSETFGLILSNLTGSAALSLASATVTIVDNDFLPGDLTFSAPAYSVGESAGSVIVTLLRTNGSTGAVSVEYATVDGTARAGNDYVGQSGTLVFTEGQTSQSIIITILDDSLVEGDEIFTVRLANPGGGTIISGPTNATVTILDEEIGPGSLDRSFDPGGGANGLVRSLALQSDGKVIAGGAFTMFDGTNRNFITRLNADGSHDLSFDPGTGANAFVSAVGAAPSGKVLLGGAFSTVGGLPFNRLAQLNTNGTPDASYNPASGLNAAVYTMTVQSNGRVLLGGAFSLPTRGITRVRPNGSVDATFSPGSGADGPVHCILVQPDGLVLLGGGFTSLSGDPHSRIARLASDGQLDIAFLTGAITNGTVFCVALQSDGKVIVGGDFNTPATTNRVRVARLNADGTLDNSFNPGLGPNDTVYAVGVDSSGKVIVAGDFTSINRINRNRYARLNTDGSLDFSFDPGLGADNTVFALIVLPDDNFIIGGDFTVVTGVSRRGVARIRGGAPLPAIVGPSVSGGVAKFSLVSKPGASCILEASQDLITWIPISTNVALTGTCELSDTNANRYNARFFRVRQVSP